LAKEVRSGGAGGPDPLTGAPSKTPQLPAW